MCNFKHLFPLLLSSNISFQLVTQNPDHRTSVQPLASLQSGFVIPISNRLSARKKRLYTEVFDLLRTSSHLTTASIKVWPRAEKILSPADWLVVIKHSKEFAFVVVKIGRQVGCFENNRSTLVGTWMQCNWQAAVTKVLTRLRLRASHCSFHQGSRCCWSQIKELHALVKTLENIMHSPYVQPRLLSIKVESETIGPRVVRNVDSSSEGWLIWSLF